MAQTKGEIENHISKMITQWEKEYLGRGSITVKTDIVRNLVIVALKGVLTPAELHLCSTREGLLSVKKIRSDLVESGSEQLKQLIEDISNQQVISFHTDISTKTGERIMVFQLKDNLEKTLSS